MKRRFLLIMTALVLALFAGAFVGCDQQGEPANEEGGLAFTQAEYSLDLYEQVTLLIDGETAETPVWSSSDPSVASVEGGVVTALKTGTVTITAAADGKSAEAEVTVYSSGAVPVLNNVPDAVKIYIGGRYKVEPQILYKGKEVAASVSYAADAPATVSFENGTIAGVAAGEATVTVSADFHGYALEQTITVTVVAAN